MPINKEIQRKKRHLRVRSKVLGTETVPRLVVFKSLLYTYAQLVDDKSGKVLASSSDLKNKEKGSKTDRAHEIGLEIAKKAQEKQISKIVFDRNGYKYHGRTKAIAEGAREGGLQF
ncbi:MAG: 50S ribosomal protein L18 [Candidatus Peregrinibacteria bacterium]